MKRLLYGFSLILLAAGCAGAPASTAGSQNANQAEAQMERLQAACDAGVATFCHELGMRLHRGEGVEEDRASAFPLFARACDLDLARSCNQVGFYLEHGLGVESNPEAAGTAYLKSCELGFAQGCTNLGLAFEFGRGVAVNYNQAKLFYQKGCDGGHGQGCHRVGILFQHARGVAADMAAAADWQEKGCELGFANSCASLGWHLDSGRGRAQDLERGSRLYDQACQGGVAFACVNLGNLLEYGRGVEQDYEAAAVAYGLGCEGGHAQACHRLGLLHVMGWGVEEDVARGVDLMRQACEGEFTPACGHLGGLYQRGQFVEADETEAARLFEQGCAAGGAQVCVQRGAMDPMEGVAYLERACELDTNSCLTGARHLEKEGARGVQIAWTLLERACAAGSWSCSWKRGLHHGALESRYQTGCDQGETGDCLHLVRLRGDEAEIDALCLQEDRPVLEAEAAESQCAEGDWQACWARSRHLIQAYGLQNRVGGLGMLGALAEDREARLRRLTAECEREDKLGSCVELGRLLRDDADRTESRRAFQRACEGDEFEGCREIALDHLKGDESSITRGIEQLDELCQGEYPRACLDQALALQEHRDGTTAAEITRLMQRACRSGDARGCTSLTHHLRSQGDSLHYQTCADHYSFANCSLENTFYCHGGW